MASGRAPSTLALCIAQRVLSSQHLATNNVGTSRMEAFILIRVGTKMKHLHTFGCPVFALQNELASGSSLPKWSPRARLGINLGPSPHHARNVYLVLNPHTGCVSPQFHCRFDSLRQCDLVDLIQLFPTHGRNSLDSFASLTCLPWRNMTKVCLCCNGWTSYPPLCFDTVLSNA